MRGTVLAAITFCSAVVSAAPGDNSLGINVHGATPAAVDAVAAMGAPWIRVDGNWFQLEPADDRFQWGPMDASVAEANRAGLAVYMTLAYTPDWVPRHGDTDARSLNDVPNGSAEWVDFVDAAVRRYRPMGVTHFGLWNEPNLEHFFEGAITEYGSIIAVPGAAAVRAACGDCVVLGPDLAHVGDVDDALEALLASIPITTFDIIAHHIYGGFVETGTQVWDGDRFFNSLDEQRFAFTRRDLRQILDGAGWTGDVWITETGYRADPSDPAEETNQATYVRRVIEEQLARPWYTNTFFYEILDCRPFQPSCDIDGFGLMRSTGTTDLGRARFPADFRTKPAFDQLQQLIMQHPELGRVATPAACADGRDNDGDGHTDLADPGCADASDDDEPDDPPPDAGTWPDASSPDGGYVDSGVRLDAEADASVRVDARAVVDGGAIAPDLGGVDAPAVVVDAGRVADGGVAADAAATSQQGQVGQPAPDGCQCVTPTVPAGPRGWLWVFIAVALYRCGTVGRRDQAFARDADVD